jgi:hypothetical protein
MEFLPSHHSALLRAGTVALPAPFPATGSVSIVLTRDDEELEVVVKILQVVSARRIITRFVRPEDIRAIQSRPAGAPTSGPESWPIRSFKKVRAEFEAREKTLRTDHQTKSILGEVLWYEAAIVHVAESAPVLHRDEIGVTAAVSAEEVAFSDEIPQSCCCCHGHSHGPPRGLEIACCHKADRTN